MSRVSIPNRRAIKACPSSCKSTQPKTDRISRTFEGRATRREHPREQQEDEQKRRVNVNVDPREPARFSKINASKLYPSSEGETLRVIPLIVLRPRPRESSFEHRRA